MAYRNIFVANTAQLTTKNEQLVVDNGERFSFPLEDIRCVLVEEARSTLSTSLIAKFAAAGVTLIVCDEKHVPCAMLSPMNAYSRQLKQIKYQMAQTLPFRKRAWQQLVTAKIRNQAACLRLNGREGELHLMHLADTVQSGDPANVEGRAAAFYFKALFGPSFRRDAEDAVNAALNYGYAILRAHISRTICLYGFEPSLGVHHCSELNNFNLSDDWIEPFRPLVDFTVVRMMTATSEFSTSQKAALLQLLNAHMQVEGKRYAAAYAVEKAVQSYTDSLGKGQPKLVTPQLIEPGDGADE